MKIVAFLRDIRNRWEVEVIQDNVCIVRFAVHPLLVWERGILHVLPL